MYRRSEQQKQKGRYFHGHPLLSSLTRWAALAFLVLWYSGVTFAQTTTVTGQVKDTNGITYAGGTLKAQLVLAGAGLTGQATVTVNNAAQCASAGKGSAPCQVPFQGTDGPITLDSTGSFTLVLQDNSLVTPAGTQWLFSITTNGAPPPLGTGPQACFATVTITGVSQSISSSVAGCPALGGTGGGDFLGTGPGPTPTATSSGLLPSVIQGIGGTGNSTTQTTIQNFSQGNTLVAVGRCSASCTISLPTDTQGNTFTTIQNSCVVGGTNPWAIFQAVNIVGGSDTVTFNTSGGTVNFGVLETTPATFDAVSACATATSTTPTTNSVTTTVPSELLLMLGQDQGSFAFNTVPPLQIVDPITTSEFAAWQQVYTTGTYTATGTEAASSAWGASLVAMKGNPPTILGGSPTINPGTQTALCTITTGNQVCQFAVRPSSQTFPTGQITVNVTGAVTSVWPIASSATYCNNNAPNPCAGFSSTVPQFVLLSSTDNGTSWQMVPGLSKASVGANPSLGASVVFSGQYNIQGLSAAWFRFMVTDGFGISNLVVTVSLG